jgi:hypothetical protein
MGVDAASWILQVRRALWRSFLGPSHVSPDDLFHEPTSAAATVFVFHSFFSGSLALRRRMYWVADMEIGRKEVQGQCYR